MKAVVKTSACATSASTEGTMTTLAERSKLRKDRDVAKVESARRNP